MELSVRSSLHLHRLPQGSNDRASAELDLEGVVSKTFCFSENLIGHGFEIRISGWLAI
jgi:hypothetical protein